MLSFCAANAGIEIDGHDELIAECGGFFETSNVAEMEQVETTVGEDDLLTGTPCGAELSQENGQRDDLGARLFRFHGSLSLSSSLSLLPKRKRMAVNGALIASGTLDIRVLTASALTFGASRGPLTLKYAPISPRSEPGRKLFSNGMLEKIWFGVLNRKMPTIARIRPGDWFVSSRTFA